MNLWRSIGGTMWFSLISADIEGAMAAINQAGIQLEQVEPVGALSIRFSISRRFSRRLFALCKNRGEELKLETRSGIYWSLTSLIHRPVLVLGMLLLLLLSLWAPGRVFFVMVDGNVTVPANLILEQAAQCGIDFGVSRRDVRSEKMKNALLEQMPQLQWAGINTYGCVAVISVSERAVELVEPDLPQVSSIVASMDAVIREITVTRGTGICQPGQAVKAGDLLISGYTDCGLCIQATRAEGEVFGETCRKFTVVSPTNYCARGSVVAVSKNYSLIIGKNRINFNNSSGISGGECVKIYSEQYVTLPGGFRLPIAIATEQVITYETVFCEYSPADADLQRFISGYLQSQMIGGRILTSWQTVTEMNGIYRIDGVYGCYEIIGITRTEERLIE